MLKCIKYFNAFQNLQFENILKIAFNYLLFSFSFLGANIKSFHPKLISVLVLIVCIILNFTFNFIVITITFQVLFITILGSFFLNVVLSFTF